METDAHRPPDASTSENNSFRDLTSLDESPRVAIPQGDLYLRFGLSGEEQFAFAATSVVEVVEILPEQITPMPNISSLLLGTFNLRGEIIWILDLRQLYGQVTTDSAGPCSVIVIQEGDGVLGLAVHAIQGMAWINADQIQDESPESLESIEEGLAQHVQGKFYTEEKPVILLAPGSIVNAKQWAAA
jgi:purine-binding chemotaxis protein CheW